MGQKVFPGRFTGRYPEGANALFLLGLRVNSWRGVVPAGQVSMSMTRMLKHLSEHPEAGLLGFSNWLGRTTVLVSYWRSAADVQRFASDPQAPHLAAWRRYAQGAGPELGVWHELYTIRPGDYESVYANMPAFGLAAAGEHLPVSEGLRTSRQRMRVSAQMGAREGE